MKKYYLISFWVLLVFGCHSSKNSKDSSDDTSTEEVPDDTSTEEVPTEQEGFTVSSKTGVWWQSVVAADAPDRITWGEAVSYCENLELGGYSDWILPELQHYIDMLENCEEKDIGNSNCNICVNSEDCSTLEGLNEEGDFWTSREYAPNDESAWKVNPVEGRLYYSGKNTKTAQARCIRGQVEVDIDLCFPNPCDDNGTCKSENGTCACDNAYMQADCRYCLFGDHLSHFPDCPAPAYSVDEETGLWWMYYSPSSVLGFEEAFEYCENFELEGHGGWRLTTLEDFMEILGNCNSENLEEIESCQPCSQSSRCTELIERREGTYWTTTKLEYEGGGFNYFTVNPQIGEISTYNQIPFKYLCVRDPE